MKNESWIDKVRLYCLKYDIPLDYLPEIIADPKVIPMIRGKAFEFSVMLKLQEVLPTSEWEIEKPFMNAQLGFHDTDVKIIHKKSQQIIRVECKLAEKGSFRELKNGERQIKVKCMRSCTLGESKVKELAPKFGIPTDLLQVHNDQYLPSDFDVVITSIGNAFYETDEETDIFEWQPSSQANTFLQQLLHTGNTTDLQHLAYQKMYIATSQSLVVNEENKVVCSRQKCTQPNSCGFIPNYPLIKFEPNKLNPQSTWVEVENCVSLLNSLIIK